MMFLPVTASVSFPMLRIREPSLSFLALGITVKEERKKVEK